MILGIFVLQVSPMLPTKIRVNWLFGSGEEAKNTLSKWPPRWPSWISEQYDFIFFFISSHPDASYRVKIQLVFRFRRRSENGIFKMSAIATILDFRLERFSFFSSTVHSDAFYRVSSQLDFSSGEEAKKIDFQDGRHGGHIGIWIGTILAIFDLQVTPMLPTYFQINWPLSSGYGGHLGFPIGTILAILDLQATPILPPKFQVSWPFGSRGEAKNRFSRWRPSWIFDRNDFSYL